MPIRNRFILVSFSCLNLKHFVQQERIYGEGLIENH